MVFGHAFQPDRLPDARDRRVPHAAALALLLSPGKVVIEVVHRLHEELVLSVRPQELRDVKTKGQIPAFVRTGLPAVHEDLRDLIHGAEMQQDTPAFRRQLQAEFSPVAEQRPLGEGPSDPREQALRAEGHEDLFLQPLRIRSEIPQAVQVLPVFPYHLRTRVGVPFPAAGLLSGFSI